MFTKLKRLAKSKYYTDLFYMNISNVKRTWQILRELLNKQPNHNIQNELFVIGNIETKTNKTLPTVLIHSLQISGKRLMTK